MVKPFLDENLRGVFATATHSPASTQPNRNVVKLTKIKSNTVYIQNVDIVDGTPLLDIKPYVPKFDKRRTSKIGLVQ